MATKSTKRGLTCGVVGCLVIVLAGIGGFVWLMYSVIFTNNIAKMMGEETYPIQGSADAYDPIAGIADTTTRAGKGAVLVELRLTSVSSSGILDLNADYKPGPQAEYKFERKLDKAPEGKTTPPIGAGRTPDSVWLETVSIRVSKPGVRRHVRSVGGGVSKEYNYTTEGMEVDRSSQMAKPNAALSLKPSVKEIWAVAIKAGAPKDAVASITYDNDGPDFNIPGVLNLRWKEDGRLDTFFMSKEVKERLGISEQ